MSKRFGPDLQLGLGVSAFDRLGQVAVIPFPVIDWRRFPDGIAKERPTLSARF